MRLTRILYGKISANLREATMTSSALDDGVPTSALSRRACAGTISPGTGGRCETRPSKFGYGQHCSGRTHPAVPAPAEVAFGSFRLLPAQFLLLEGDKPVRLGSRALDILIALLERPGELVSKQELMASGLAQHICRAGQPYGPYFRVAPHAARWARWQPVHHQHPRARLRIRRCTHALGPES